ncbi:zinc finger protein 358-like isoform X3 [Toxorhynchites rutilus septentrionalis]|uniref:zinc finger protein 358-like isoform X3 n=1 Tax=Toxorhynchites rutilus septentrionalis TaxID=329112 RepID=UPI0024790B5F|nr:zinc finger protein 358-like isoform X3 [Toxorhynchites rutilus septentrionalis]
MEQDFEIDDHYHNELSDNDNISETDPMADFGPNGQKARSSVTRTGQLPQYCPHCSKSFTHFTALKMHVRTHAGGEHPFICVQCPKTFKTYPAFKKHIKIHMAERPYPCPHCPKGFMQSHHLNRHISVHTRARPLSCPHCLKTFRQSKTFRKHLANIHGEDTSVPGRNHSKGRDN